MDDLIQLDQRFFIFINKTLGNPVFDTILPFFRNANFWAPFYVFMIAFLFFNFKKNTWWWLLFAIATAGLSDQISSGLLKPLIHRIRPCNDPEMISQMIYRLGYKSSSFSFPSSHAVNHFAVATFIHRTWKPHVGNITYFLFVWAFFIILSQVYVGVHYPFDVTAGAFIGIMIGWFTSTIYSKKFTLQ